ERLQILIRAARAGRGYGMFDPGVAGVAGGRELIPVDPAGSYAVLGVADHGVELPVAVDVAERLLERRVAGVGVDRDFLEGRGHHGRQEPPAFERLDCRTLLGSPRPLLHGRPGTDGPRARNTILQPVGQSSPSHPAASASTLDTSATIT